MDQRFQLLSTHPVSMHLKTANEKLQDGIHLAM